MRAAKDAGAMVLIAKLDRLARNVHFVSGLMESGVKFTAVDMPQVDNLTIHILAAVEAYWPITGYVQLLYESGLGHEAIARRLNEEGHQTRRGKRFYAMTVYRILERVGTT